MSRPLCRRRRRKHLLPFRFQIWHFPTDRRVLCMSLVCLTQPEFHYCVKEGPCTARNRRQAWGDGGVLTVVRAGLVLCCYGNTKDSRPIANTAEWRAVSMALSGCSARTCLRVHPSHWLLLLCVFHWPILISVSYGRPMMHFFTARLILSAHISLKLARFQEFITQYSVLCHHCHASLLRLVIERVIAL